MIDLSEIDVILISNLHNMLALPYITEYTSFSGKILATEPTVQMARYSLKYHRIIKEFKFMSNFQYVHV